MRRTAVRELRQSWLVSLTIKMRHIFWEEYVVSYYFRILFFATAHQTLSNMQDYDTNTLKLPEEQLVEKL